MDFTKVNIPQILYSAIPKRFQDFSPQDFEDFICQVFRDNEFDVEQTKYSGDFGADLILYKDENPTVVQIKRYAENNKVGVKDINQVLGSKEYYNANSAMVITTSSFTPQAIALCNKANVLYWDWYDLLKLLCDTYFDGTDYYTYFRNQIEEGNSQHMTNNMDNDLEYQYINDIFDFSITRFITGLATAGKNQKNVSALLVDVKNKSQENIYLNVFLPDFITPEHRQIEACSRWSEYFSKGVIYAGTTVTLGFFFLASQLQELKIDSKLILKLSLDDQNLVRQFLEINSLDDIQLPEPIPEPKGGGICFVATALFGKGSVEYNELTYFRDNFLDRYAVGRFLIECYYKTGPRLVIIMRRNHIIRHISKIIVRNLARLTGYVNKRL